MIGGQGTGGNGRKLTFGLVPEAAEFEIAVLDPSRTTHFTSRMALRQKSRWLPGNSGSLPFAVQ